MIHEPISLICQLLCTGLQHYFRQYLAKKYYLKYISKLCIQSYVVLSSLSYFIISLKVQIYVLRTYWYLTELYAVKKLSQKTNSLFHNILGGIDANNFSRKPNWRCSVSSQHRFVARKSSTPTPFRQSNDEEEDDDDNEEDDDDDEEQTFFSSCPDDVVAHNVLITKHFCFNLSNMSAHLSLTPHTHEVATSTAAGDFCSVCATPLDHGASLTLSCWDHGNSSTLCFRKERKTHHTKVNPQSAAALICTGRYLIMQINAGVYTIQSDSSVSPNLSESSARISTALSPRKED